MNRFGCCLATALALVLFATPTVAQTFTEPVDDQAVELIRKHGLDESHLQETFFMMTDVHGMRLTGSPELDIATAWAAEAMESMGLENVKQEAWGPFGRGWSLNDFHVFARGESASFPVFAYPKAWSHGTDGTVTGEVVIIDPASIDDLDALAAAVAGKIVLMSPIRELEEPFTPMASRHDDDDLLKMANWAGGPGGGRSYSPEQIAKYRAERAAASVVLTAGPLAVVDASSKGDYGTIFVSSASVPTAPDAGFFGGPSAHSTGAPVTPPQFTMAVEHYNRIARLVEAGYPMSLEFNLDVTFNDDDPMEYNVIGEIPGTDPKLADEIVMVGAHYDAWHAGTGATDNASGSAVMMEAMRILKNVYAEKGTAPRRTIRIALWTGEEQGIYGSSAYVKDHFAVTEGGSFMRAGTITEVHPDHAKLSAYYNYDNGTGRIRGVYQQGNEGVGPIFKAWMRPFQDLGAGTLTLQNTTGTDHLSFDAVGLPGFQFIQEPMAYSTKTHHSNMDVYDHGVIDDLKQSATIVAAFVYHTSERDEMMPRKPMPKPADEETSSSGR